MTICGLVGCYQCLDTCIASIFRVEASQDEESELLYRRMAREMEKKVFGKGKVTREVPKSANL